MRKFGKVLSGALSSAMLVSSLIVPGSSVFADTKVEINEKVFPDEALREVVTEFDTDSDGFLNEEEIQNALFFDASQRGIKSTKGIEVFDNLISLDLSENEIEEIDLSKNESILSLSVFANKLTDIDLSKNTKLEVLTLSQNEFTSIDLSKNTNLINLTIAENKITSVDLSKNNKIQYLDVIDNPLTSIDVSKLPNLATLSVANTNIDKIDVTKNPNLEHLVLSSTNISSLDVTKNPKLYTLYLYKTKLTSLDLSKNQNITYLDLSETGIKMTDFSSMPNLERLSVRLLGLDSINVTKNPRLMTLDAEENNLTSIDLSKNPLLSSLFISRNKLTKIDLSKNAKLEYLYIDDNSLTSLDVSKCTNIVSLNAGYNKISSIDLNTNPSLQIVNLSGNYNLNSVDLSKLPFLTSVFLIDCGLDSIDVSKNEELERLYVGSNRIETIDVSNNPMLKALNFYKNIVTDVNLKGCTELKELECFDNDLKTLDLTGTALADAELEYFEGLGYKLGRDHEADDRFYFFVELAKISYEEYGFLCDSGVTINGLKKEFVNPTEIKNDGAERFVERLYTTCLSRLAEKEGVEYWTGELKKGFSGGDLARSFFFSEEFQNQNLSDEEFIIRLYGTFMAREADKDGLDYWLGEMKSGKDKNFVFDGFVNSPEWAAICRDFSIVSGGTGVPENSISPSKVVRDFAKRLYTTCLGRSAEEDGLLYWSNEIANLRVTGTQAAISFFFSDEFINAKYDNKEFVTRLYGTFMNRTPDADGLNYWVDQLANGVSREDVLMGFSAAPEFADICANAGIMR